ncbi:unnamed protein product, partial [Staurois parvus]
PGSVQHRNPVPAVSRSSCSTAIRCPLCPDHVITDWPISDHMNSSKQDVTS